jgi:hypothetical protein
MRDPIGEITKAKSGWRCGSSGRTPVQQVQGPKFKFHTIKKYLFKIIINPVHIPKIILFKNILNH